MRKFCFGNIVTYIEKDRRQVKNAEAGDIVYIGDIIGTMSKGDKVYKISDKNLNLSLRKVLDGKCYRKVPVDMELYCGVNENVELSITDDDGNVSNSRIDSLLSHGYNLGVGDLAGYKYYNQIPESWWKSHGFATGGYTGNWDGTGKLAFLHQKELVLNAEDTENMLKTIEIVRTIAKSIDLNSAMMAQGLGVLNPTTIAKEMFGQLEQDVHIEANFPNVTNHSEIEEAFNNLINISSQYANRKI